MKRRLAQNNRGWSEENKPCFDTSVNDNNNNMGLV